MIFHINVVFSYSDCDPRCRQLVEFESMAWITDNLSENSPFQLASPHLLIREVSTI